MSAPHRPPLPWRVRLVVLGTVAIALLATPLCWTAPGQLAGAQVLIAAVMLGLLATAAHARPFKVAPKRTVSAATAPELAAALLLPGPWVAAVLLVGVVLGEARRPARFLQRLFNAALALLRAGVGSALAATLLRLGPHSLLEPLAALAAAVAMYGVAHLAVQTIAAVQLRRPLWRQLRSARRDVWALEAALAVVGSVAAVAAADQLWVLPTLLLPAAVADWALRRSAALRASEERSQQLLATSPDLILLIAPDGTIRYANAAAEAVLGQPAPAVVGRSALELFTAGPATDATAHPLAAWLLALRRDEPPAGTLQLALGGDGGKGVVLEARSRLLREAAPGEPQLLVLARDITERAQLERLQAQTLRREREVRQAAEQTNRAKDEFLAVLSHELRTPLTGVIAAIQLLRRRVRQDAELLRLTELVERNAQAQAHLVAELLDVSRIAAGKLRIAHDPVDLSTVVKEVSETYRLVAAEKGVRLQLDDASEHAVVQGDAERLRQVVVNLLANAVKFTPRGGAVRAEVRETREQVQLRVQDTGAGISPAFLPHVFEQFRQGDGSATREHEGLGLGLAIVHTLIALHGGQITAESPGEGQGATFTVALPRLTDSEPAAEPAPAEGERPPLLAGLRVLVVEDSADTREVLQLVLEDAGATVRTAGSVAEALAVLDQQLPDVLVSDLAMPEQDGYDLLRALRRRDPAQGGQLPALALSAFASPDDQTRALAAGFQAHLGKPLRVDALLHAIAALAGRATPSA